MPREIESGRERPSDLKSLKSSAATRRPTTISPAKPNSSLLPVSSVPDPPRPPPRDSPRPRGYFCLIVALLHSFCDNQRLQWVLHVSYPYNKRLRHLPPRTQQVPASFVHMAGTRPPMYSYDPMSHVPPLCRRPKLTMYLRLPQRSQATAVSPTAQLNDVEAPHGLQ